MDLLVQAALRMRRGARRGHGLAVAAAYACLLLVGAFASFPSDWGAGAYASVIALGGWIVWRLRLRASLRRDTGARALIDLELALFAVLVAHVLAQASGGIDGPLHPVTYVAVAVGAAFLPAVAGLTVVLTSVALELALGTVTEQGTPPGSIALHVAYTVAFGVLSLAMTRAEIQRVRRRHEQELDQAKARVREDARLYRLVATPIDGARHDDERLFQSSVEEVRLALFHSLDLLRKTLGLHTCALLLRDETGDELRVAELVTESDDIAEGPFRVGEGVVGAVVARGLAMNLEQLKAGYKGLCYYRGPAVVQACLAVPVLEGDHVRGVLAADRLENRPFGPKEEEILRGAAQQIVRALANERVFVQLERSKREQSVLYRASQALVVARTEDEAIEGGLSAAREVAPYDFGAVTLYDPKRRKHRVRVAVGEEADRFAGLEFRDNASLTAMAVKNRHYLPYRGEFDANQQVAFTRKANLRNMRSLLIMPLVVREDAIGTLTLAAHRADAFTESVRRTAQVLANQLAVALANAASVRRLEELATTDGLTGCLNKRAFLDELERKMASAQRFKRKLSLVVADLDHFKTVNDTYGHAVGDLILEGLGEILRSTKRETDVVARFGGEEFCVLCEETTTEGARLLAERVREEVGTRVFQTEQGRLHVTCSLGIATFPDGVRDARELFEAADRALYAAKHGGRNRVCAAGEPSGLKLRSA